MSTTMKPKTGPQSLTPRDTELLIIGVTRCLAHPDGLKVSKVEPPSPRNPPSLTPSPHLISDPQCQLNLDRFAEEAGFKNRATASVIWGSLKRKLLGGQPIMKCTPNKPSSAKAKPAKGTAATHNDDTDDDEEQPNTCEPPSKKVVSLLRRRIHTTNAASASAQRTKCPHCIAQTH